MMFKDREQDLAAASTFAKKVPIVKAVRRESFLTSSHPTSFCYDRVAERSFISLTTNCKCRQA